MFKKILSGVLATCGIYAYAGSAEGINPLVKVGELLSDKSDVVERRLTLYSSDKNAYFRKYENDLLDIGIEGPNGIRVEVVLISALKESGSLAYVDYAMEADQVLLMLNKLSGEKLASNPCFAALLETYKGAGKHNAIGNFLYNEKIGPMPFGCLSESGYALGNIDEGSDSFAFFLMETHSKKRILSLAKEAKTSVRLF